MRNHEPNGPGNGCGVYDDVYETCDPGLFCREGKCVEPVCPSQYCVVGTKGCNTQGELVDCLDSQDEMAPAGCGEYADTSFETCGEDAICYRGQCIAPSNIPLPQASTDPNFRSILAETEANYSVPFCRAGYSI